MTLMTIDEFVARLNPKNPMFEDLRGLVSRWLEDEDDNLRLYDRDKSLYEIVKELKRDEYYPIVDRRLRAVFGLKVGHGLFRTGLYRYFFYGRNPLEKYIDPNESQDRYVSEGWGWFISGMQPDVIIAGARYSPDNFDTEIFSSHTVIPYAPTAAELIRRSREY